MKKEFNFDNKNILITGASGHLGSKLVKFYEQYQCNLILIDQKNNKTKLEKNKKKNYFFCNFQNLDSLNNTLKKIKKKYSKIDIIINNAGLTKNNFGKKNYLYFNQKLWENHFFVNVISVDLIIKSLIQNLKKSQEPCIVNVASIYGILKPDFRIYKNSKIKNSIEYSSTKSALIQLTKWYSSFLSPKIRVNSISPGGIERGQPTSFINNYKKKTLIKRMATDQEIIYPIAFLTSSFASYITGENFFVDGGFFSR